VGAVGEDEGLGDAMEGLGVADPPLGNAAETAIVEDGETPPVAPVFEELVGSSPALAAAGVEDNCLLPSPVLLPELPELLPPEPPEPVGSLGLGDPVEPPES